MFSKHTSGNNSPIFVASILLAGMSIGYPAIRNANAAINVGQATNPTNICGANQNPVFCSKYSGNLVNLGIIAPTSEGKHTYLLEHSNHFQRKMFGI